MTHGPGGAGSRPAYAHATSAQAAAATISAIYTTTPQILSLILLVVSPTFREMAKTKKAKDDENPALATPLSYAGTPEELDAELGKHLASYVECHTQLGSTLSQAKAEMEAAAKAAQEEARKKAAERGKKATDKPAAYTDSAPATPPAPPPAATMTLFGGTQPAASASGEHSPTVTAAAGGERTCKLAL
jgi:PRTRC genetic system protein E